MRVIGDWWSGISEAHQPPINHQPPITPTSRRRGVTLLELLVVLLILLMVTAAAIPIVVPAMQNRQMREASRLVSSYLSQARSRAIETGRPVGVKLERFNGQPFAMVLSQVEVPPPYGGDTESSVCAIRLGGPTGASSTGRAPVGTPWFTVHMDLSFNNASVRVGDQIQFGAKGLVYTILGPDEPPSMTLPPDGIIDSLGTDSDTDGFLDTPLDVAYLQVPGLPQPAFPWPAAGTLPSTNPAQTFYQIVRQPIRSSTEPLQLPEGVVVDLVSSGMGTGTFDVADYSGTYPAVPPAPNIPFDPVILFSPAGRLDSVSANAFGQLQRPTDAVYLLVGKRELMYDVTSKGRTEDIVDQNLSPIPIPHDVQPPPAPHFWISVGYQTGLVTVSEVAASLQDYEPASAPPWQQVKTTVLFDARKFARESQSAGGR